MSRGAWLAGTLAATAAGITGYWAGDADGTWPAAVERARTQLSRLIPGAAGVTGPSPARFSGKGPVIYYQDPDGKPAYAATPTRTSDGRDYRAVQASEDIRFDIADGADALSDAAAERAKGPSMGGRKVLYYRNPMGLPDTSPTPKKDSMGMDYLPVFEDDADDARTVRVSPGKVQRTGVRSEPAERRVVRRPVRVPGIVALDERRVTVVATRSDAYVDHVENVTTGDRVRRGQALVHVYSPEINAAAAQLIANPGFDGARRRLQNLNVSEEVINEIERTRKVPMAITWSAGRDGIILVRNAVEGMKAAAGDTLFRVGDISTVWVLADVPEHELGSIQVGQSVSVRLRARPGRSFTGKVGLIYPQVNAQTRTTRVRIELANLDGVLLPDMYAEVEIATGLATPVIAVPSDAVIDTGARQVVLVDKAEGRFEPREVKLGTRGEGYTEIREGVQAGEQVVTSANFLIDAESNLKAALQSMAVPKPPPEPPAVAGEQQP